MTAPTELVLAEPGEFPDDELLIRLYLAETVALHGEQVVFTDEPANPLRPPVGTVQRLPGLGVRKAGREAVRRLETAVLGVSRADTRDLSTQVENAMLALSGTAYRGILVDRVTQNVGPAQVPYAPDIRRLPSTWDLTFRRHRGQRVTA